MRYIFILILFFSCNNQNLKSDIDQKVDDIISQMTLEEKVGQMTQINLTDISFENLSIVNLKLPGSTTN